MPMLLILLISTIWALNSHSSSPESEAVSFLNLALQSEKIGYSQKTSESSTQTGIFQRYIKSFQAKTDALQTTSKCLRKFAIPQFLLTVLALTNYHVQIIMRISSGYVVWYWWLATIVTQQKKVTF